MNVKPAELRGNACSTVATCTMRAATTEDLGHLALVPADITDVDGKLVAVPRTSSSPVELPIFMTDYDSDPAEPQTLFPKYKLSDAEISVANAYQIETAIELIATEDVTTHAEFMECIKYNFKWFSDWAVEAIQRAEKPYYSMISEEE